MVDILSDGDAEAACCSDFGEWLTTVQVPDGKVEGKGTYVSGI